MGFGHSFVEVLSGVSGVPLGLHSFVEVLSGFYFFIFFLTRDFENSLIFCFLPFMEFFFYQAGHRTCGRK